MPIPFIGMVATGAAVAQAAIAKRVVRIAMGFMAVWETEGVAGKGFINRVTWRLMTEASVCVYRFCDS